MLLELKQQLIQQPYLFYGITILLGLTVGSFLNVVIYRLPIMLQKEWQQEAKAILDMDETTSSDDATFNLFWPRSKCTNCQQQLRAWHNIPVISFLLLGGKCAFCQDLISKRYPLVELFTALIFLWAAIHFGPTPQWFVFIIVASLLIAGSGIDIDHHILPDQITFSMLWLGLLCSIHHIFMGSEQAILGAFWGYMSLWLFVHGYYLLSGKFGMGHGDFKLLAATGAFVGWTKLPVVIIISSSIGALYGLLLILSKRSQADNPIPFGPFLAGASFLCLLYGDHIIQIYWQQIVMA